MKSLQFCTALHMLLMMTAASLLSKRPVSKKLFYEAKINDKKNNPKELWKFINSVIPSKRTSSFPPKIIKVDSDEIDNPERISEQFNNYFVEIGHLIAKSISTTDKLNFHSFMKSSVSPTIFLDPPQPIEIFNAINLQSLWLRQHFFVFLAHG